MDLEFKGVKHIANLGLRDLKYLKKPEKINVRKPKKRASPLT